MSAHGLTTALTLYRSGTLTLVQAVRRAGLTGDDFAAALRKRGFDVREEGGVGGRRSARAD